MNPGFFKDVFESTRCGILTIDESGRVTNVNQVGKSILSLPEACSEPTPCEEFLRNHPEMSRILLDSLHMENPPGRFEIDIDAQGRPKRVIGGTISHIRDGKGRREGAVLFFKDLTQIEEGEEQESLKERLAAIGQMAAGLAHEIRNPLGNIGSTATLLKRKLSGNDSGILALNNIVQEVRRLNHTVTQCLEYAKPVNLKFHPLNLVSLVLEVVEDVQAKWPRGGVHVTESHTGKIGALMADGFQLRHVFHNLIANAFDAMDGKGELGIITLLEPSGHKFAASAISGEDSPPYFAVVRIRDSGRGITPEARERMFFPFFTTKPGGSGIGLAVAKKIVDSHRGLIDVESEPKRGATFSVKLPYPGGPIETGVNR
jgi:signal transduction histidine kinase